MIQYPFNDAIIRIHRAKSLGGVWCGVNFLESDKRRMCDADQWRDDIWMRLPPARSPLADGCCRGSARLVGLYAGVPYIPSPSRRFRDSRSVRCLWVSYGVLSLVPISPFRLNFCRTRFHTLAATMRKLFVLVAALFLLTGKPWFRNF